MPLPDLATQADQLVKLNRLYEIKNLMQAYALKNMQLLGVTPQSVVKSYFNPNLYKIAAAVYGDSRYWTVIARANKITDPLYKGTISLLIPPKPTQVPTGILEY